jgi:hypothetical protein
LLQNARNHGSLFDFQTVGGIEMIASRAILNIKLEMVIEELARQENISLRLAMDRFYKSRTYKEIREGVSDMHCRSDKYLVEEIRRE